MLSRCGVRKAALYISFVLKNPVARGLASPRKLQRQPIGQKGLSANLFCQIRQLICRRAPAFVKPHLFVAGAFLGTGMQQHRAVACARRHRIKGDDGGHEACAGRAKARAKRVGKAQQTPRVRRQNAAFRGDLGAIGQAHLGVESPAAAWLDHRLDGFHGGRGEPLHQQRRIGPAAPDRIGAGGNRAGQMQVQIRCHQLGLSVARAHA